MRNEIGLILHISKWFVGCSSLYLGYFDKREKRTCKKDYQVETKKDLIDVSKNLISFPCQMQGKAFEFFNFLIFLVIFKILFPVSLHKLL